MSSSAASLDPVAMRAWVTDYLADLSNSDSADIDLSKGLDSFGLDSVDAVVMGAAMEEAFGIEFDPAVFIEHRNLEDMIAWLSAGRAGSAVSGRDA